jgi:hypothetical protein
MRHSAAAFVPVVLVTLACSGLAPTETDPPPGDGPSRTLPSGDPAPIGIVEFQPNGTDNCDLRLKTIPGDEDKRLGAFGPADCPTEALVTWSADRVVVVDQNGMWVEAAVGKRVGTDVPEAPQIVVFDDAGDLHACATVDVEAKEKDDATMQAQWRGKEYTTEKLDDADGYQMWVHWKREGDEWKVAEAELEAIVDPEGVPVCQRLPDFPRDDPWASSTGQQWTTSDWPEPAEADRTALEALEAGTWRVDPGNAVAVVGEVDDQRFVPTGPVALWVDGAWKQVYESITALWLDDGWVAVSDSGALSLFSRHDGAKAYEAPEGVLAFPWPSDAPAVEAPEAVPEPEPAEEPEPEPKEEPEPEPNPEPKPGGEYNPGGRGKAKSGKNR